jgi:hypothetical protein
MLARLGIWNPVLRSGLPPMVTCLLFPLEIGECQHSCIHHSGTSCLTHPFPNLLLLDTVGLCRGGLLLIALPKPNTLPWLGTCRGLKWLNLHDQEAREARQCSSIVSQGSVGCILSNVSTQKLPVLCAVGKLLPGRSVTGPNR